MNFADLYRIADRIGKPATPVMELTRQVVASHPVIGEVRYHAVDLDIEISLGHIVFDKDRSSGYGEEFKVASIRVARELNRCWRRLVCCKELMHVFDGRTQRVNTKDRFIQLLSELESKPLAEDISDMYGSEQDAMWMAILVLCPMKRRNDFAPDYKSGKLSKQDLAEKLKVPVQAINGIMGDYYPIALERLTGDPSAS